MKNDIKAQIDRITIELIKKGLTVSENFPIISGNEVIWQNFKAITHALKNSSYHDTYHKFLEDKAYNFILIDLTIVQLMYRFDVGNNLIEHRLALYPHPDLERFLDDPTNFETKYYSDRAFSDIVSNIENSASKFPIRFDFNADDSIAIDCDHPYSHLTLGDYVNCRIPVISPITPYRFVKFILRNFYFEKYITNFSNLDFQCDLSFNKLITRNESKLLHISFD